MVVIDASVLDAGRRPVRGLTVNDFVLREDSQPQTISAFRAIEAPQELEPARAAWTRDVQPDVSSNNIAPADRVVVIVLDDSTPMRADEVPRVKKVARDVVERLAPTDLAAVVFTGGNQHAQDFTRDKKRLLAAIDTFIGGLLMEVKTPWGLALADYGTFITMATTKYFMTLNTLQAVAESLAPLRERRKAVVFISVGLPLDYETAGARLDVISGDDVTNVARDVIKKMDDVFEAAALANVNVYALDPGGLRPEKRKLNSEFLQTVAANTGGIAVVDRNEPGPEVAKALQETTRIICSATSRRIHVPKAVFAGSPSKHKGTLTT